MMTAIFSYVPDHATDSVADLLLGIGDGNPASWGEIIRRYGKVVSRTVRSFRLQEADTADAIQMTWLRLAENSHRVKFPERLGRWLATTARRESLHILRQVKLRPNLTDGALEIVSAPSVSPEQRAIDADTARTLQKIIGELPPRQRILIRMLFAHNPCSYAEAAHAAGIPPGGIGPTRARALRQLRNKLDQHEMQPSI